MKKTKKPKKTKSMTLYELQISAIQSMADEFHEGDFGRAMRNIVNMWMNKK